jgi:hypothetical protein
MSELTATRESSANTMPSAELLEKLKLIDRELLEETGGVILFGLFEPEDAPGQWDLLIAADWVGPDVAPAIAYVARKVQERLTPDELVSLAGIVALRSSDPSVRQLLTGTIEVKGVAQIENCTFNGLHVTRAWIFTANLNSHSSFQPPPYLAPQPVRTRSKTERKAAAGAKNPHRKR